MRSRDGNYSFSRAICSLILFNSLALHASEYLISYRYIVKDATLYNETLHISKSMTKCYGSEQKELILHSDGSENLAKIVSDNEEEFIDYIHKLGLHIEHKELTLNLQHKSTTILTLKTTCFKVDFNDNFARIAPLK